MTIKRTRLAEKKPTIKLKRAAEKEREIQKPPAIAVAAFHQLAKVETEDRILPPNFRIFQTLGTGAWAPYIESMMRVHHCGRSDGHTLS